jgi:hypothetical protein
LHPLTQRRGGRRYRYAAIHPTFANLGSHKGKLFELNSYKPAVLETDVLLFGPTKCGDGEGLKNIWYAANPGLQWKAKAGDIEAVLEEKGLLRDFHACEMVALRKFINDKYQKKQDIWVTQLINFERAVHELTLEVPKEGVPKSSLLWPFLQIPDGKVPEWLDCVCRPCA